MMVENSEMKKGKRKKGFTLAEILVSVTVFSLVFGAIASLYVMNLKAQRKYLAVQQLLTDAGYAMSYMSSQLERGLTQTYSNCPDTNCCIGFGSECPDEVSYMTTSVGIRFISHRGECVEFNCLPAEKRLYQTVSCPPISLHAGYITASGLSVDAFRINIIRGNTTTESKAPRITIYLKMSTAGKEKSSIKLQTTISKRKF